MFGTSIKARVWSVIKDKIADAQRECDEKIAGLDTKYKDDMATLKLTLCSDKRNVVETTVENLLKKII
jgi:hypothetical protein